MKFSKIFMGITNRCNAKCFTCNREVYTKYQYNNETSIDLIERIVPFTDELNFIGEMGDFIFHPKSLEIADLVIRKHNTFMRTDTNGNRPDQDYWKALGELTAGTESYVRFMIDDLEDDKHRVGVDTQQVLRNIQTFIDAGGNAYVKTILFDFNYNKIDAMAQVFKDMGVQKYHSIKSRWYQDSGPLSAPPGVQSSLKTFDVIVEGKSKGDLNNIKVKECHWAKNKLCYINEFGELKVCCHLVFEGIVFAQEIDSFMEPYIGREMFQDLLDLYERNKKLINLNTPGVTLESAYSNEFNQTLINNPNDFKICKYRCNLPNHIKDRLLYDNTIF